MQYAASTCTAGKSRLRYRISMCMTQLPKAHFGLHAHKSMAMEYSACNLQKTCTWFSCAMSHVARSMTSASQRAPLVAASLEVGRISTKSPGL